MGPVSMLRFHTLLTWPFPVSPSRPGYILPTISAGNLSFLARAMADNWLSRVGMTAFAGWPFTSLIRTGTSLGWGAIARFPLETGHTLRPVGTGPILNCTSTAKWTHRGRRGSQGWETPAARSALARVALAAPANISPASLTKYRSTTALFLPGKSRRSIRRVAPGNAQ